MTGFHDHDDLSYLPKVKDAAPKEFAAWVGLDKHRRPPGRGDPAQAA